MIKKPDYWRVGRTWFFLPLRTTKAKLRTAMVKAATTAMVSGSVYPSLDIVTAPGLAVPVVRAEIWV